MPIFTQGQDNQSLYVSGVQAKQAISAANETVSEGVYDATTLSTVDSDLAVGNIKEGVTIFGFAGTFTDTAVAPTAAQVLKDKECWANGAKITGTMETRTLSAANETVNEGYYAATTLSAVDSDLAVGNIKSGVTIFGFAGTHTGTATHDIQGQAQDGTTGTTSQTMYRYAATLYATGGAPSQWAIKTQSYTAGCVTECYGGAECYATTANTIKLGVVANSVLLAETGYITTSFDWYHISSYDTSLSGSKSVAQSFQNWDDTSRTINVLCDAGSGSTGIAVVFAGAVKAV